MDILIIKMIGGSMIFVGCALYGIQAGHQYRVRAGHLCKIEEILLYMQNEVRYRILPLPEIGEQLRERLNHPYDLLFPGTKENSDHYMELWEQCVENFAKETGLKGLDILPLMEMIEQSNLTDKIRQEAVFDLCIQRIKQQEHRINEEYQNKNKVYRSLGFFVGILSIILLI